LKDSLIERTRVYDLRYLRQRLVFVKEPGTQTDDNDNDHNDQNDNDDEADGSDGSFADGGAVDPDVPPWIDGGTGSCCSINGIDRVIRDSGGSGVEDLDPHTHDPSTMRIYVVLTRVAVGDEKRGEKRGEKSMTAAVSGSGSRNRSRVQIPDSCLRIAAAVEGRKDDAAIESDPETKVGRAAGACGAAGAAGGGACAACASAGGAVLHFIFLSVALAGTSQ
jgi:hypothetical protein